MGMQTWHLVKLLSTKKSGLEGGAGEVIASIDFSKAATDEKGRGVVHSSVWNCFIVWFSLKTRFVL